MTNRAAHIVAFSLALLLPHSIAHATWQVDGTLVCAEATSQNGSVAIPDGAFIAWTDARNGATDIYMQRVDSSGKPDRRSSSRIQ